MIKIFIHPVRGLGPGALSRYRVTLDSPAGEVLCENARTPLLDACRRLQDMGRTGRVEMWRTDAEHPAMLADIDKAALLTVRESEKSGPAFTKFTPFTGPEAA